MKDRQRTGRDRRVATLLACLVASLLVGGVLGLATRSAAAQGFGWFGGLFGGGGGGDTYPRQSPSYPGGYGAAPGPAYQPHRRPRHRAPDQAERSAPREVPAAAPVEKTPPPKKNAAISVYVLGDTLGQFLANGLDEALADRQDVAVVHKARGPSGLVTKDYFDWPKAIDTLLAGKDKIDVAIMMVGSNDHQPITEDGKSYDPGSDEWNAIYAKRVLAIDEAFHKKGVPLVWVGVPITKNPDFADSMAALNDIYRDAAAKTGAVYVDTWEAFGDDNGEFAAFGPDIKGQNVRLRSSDGIMFTAAGARKLAHFVEAPVRRDLDGKAPPPALPTAPGALAALPKAVPGVPKPAAAKPEAGPITSLTEAPSAPDAQLMAPASSGDGSSAERLVKGDIQAAPAGRADDLRWPPKSP